MNIPRQRFENTQRVFLPAVTVVEITDPTVADEGIGVVTRDLLQLETKPLRARQRIVRLEDSMFLFQTTNIRVWVHSELHTGGRNSRKRNPKVHLDYYTLRSYFPIHWCPK